MSIRARILSPERGSPYLGFDCRRWVKSLTMTLFATLSYWGSLWSLSSRIPEIPYAEYSPCVPMVMHLDLLSNLKFLYEINKGFERWGWWLLQLLVRFLSVTWFDLGALFDLQWEGEYILLLINVELNFSSSYINVCIRRMSFPKWEGSWCRLPYWGRQNQQGWRNSVFSLEYSLQSLRDNEMTGPLVANIW